MNSVNDRKECLNTLKTNLDYDTAKTMYKLSLRYITSQLAKYDNKRAIEIMTLAMTLFSTLEKLAIQYKIIEKTNSLDTPFVQVGSARLYKSKRKTIKKPNQKFQLYKDKAIL